MTGACLVSKFQTRPYLEYKVEIETLKREAITNSIPSKTIVADYLLYDGWQHSDPCYC